MRQASFCRCASQPCCKSSGLASASTTPPSRAARSLRTSRKCSKRFIGGHLSGRRPEIRREGAPTNRAKGVPRRAEVSLFKISTRRHSSTSRNWHASCLINTDHGHVITPPQVASRAVLPPFFCPQADLISIHPVKTAHYQTAPSPRHPSNQRGRASSLRWRHLKFCTILVQRTHHSSAPGSWQSLSSSPSQNGRRLEPQMSNWHRKC